MSLPEIDLTICIVTWNARALTFDCIKSVIEQTHRISYEIVLVDNGSIDGTLEKINQHFPQVITIANKSNEGFNYANNRALETGKGRYLILLNNDMVLESDALSKMVEYLDNNPDIGVLSCRLRFPHGGVQQTAHGDADWIDFLFASFYLYKLFPKSRLFGRMDYTYLDYEKDDMAIDVGWAAGAALMVPRAVLDRVGLLDERIFIFSEDWEFCRRVANAGYRVVYYTGAEIIHYHGMGTTSYIGPQLQEVRKNSILRLTATAGYVFRKMHKNAFLQIFLFDLAYRLFCFSRAIVFGIKCIILPKSGLYGFFCGYLQSIFMSYKSLAKKYLRSVNA